MSEGKAEFKSAYHRLEALMHEGTMPSRDYPYVFIHKDDEGKRKYTEDEMVNMKQRDYQTRLFVIETPVCGEGLVVQTHFSDNHKHACQLNMVRDLLKASFGVRNYTAARSILTQLLATGFQNDKSSYCSFAATVASGLSNNAERTNFQLLDDPGGREDGRMVKGASKASLHKARHQLCVLMDLVFSKFQAHKFLLKDNGTNIYRLGFCRARIAELGKDRLFQNLDVIFCFLLQLALAAYVVADVLDTLLYSEDGEEEEDLRLNMLPLAIISTLYTLIIFRSDLNDTQAACTHVYPKNSWSFFKIADITINIGLHPLLLVSGFLLIFKAETYIDAVLNAAALMFIIELDDTIHELLGTSFENVVENFLVRRSMQELDKCINSFVEDPPASKAATLKSAMASTSGGIDFCDYYLTNCPEEGADTMRGIVYQPFRVVGCKDSFQLQGDLISPSRVVTERCLIKKITWWYTAYNATTNPRIGKLKLELFVGRNREIIINPDRESMGDSVKLLDPLPSQVLEGVFIITSFQMSVDILRLRVCGSRTATDFKKAFELYSLWEINDGASDLLDKQEQKEEISTSKDTGPCSDVNQRSHHVTMTGDVKGSSKR